MKLNWVSDFTHRVALLQLLFLYPDLLFYFEMSPFKFFVVRSSGLYRRPSGASPYGIEE